MLSGAAGTTSTLTLQQNATETHHVRLTRDAAPPSVRSSALSSERVWAKPPVVSGGAGGKGRCLMEAFAHHADATQFPDEGDVAWETPEGVVDVDVVSAENLPVSNGLGFGVWV